MKKICIAQLAKSPELGKVKTRMQPYLSSEQALKLHSVMSEWIVRSCSEMKKVDHQLWSTEGGDFIHELCARYGSKHYYQVGEDLGQRLDFICQQTLADYETVILMGSDCPFISAEHIEQTIQLLAQQTCDVVIQPADDGGYVLLALKSPCSSLFSNIDWGTDVVLRQSLEKAQQASLQVETLPSLPDIDRPEDLVLLRDLPELVDRLSDIRLHPI